MTQETGTGRPRWVWVLAALVGVVLVAVVALVVTRQVRATGHGVRPGRSPRPPARRRAPPPAPRRRPGRTITGPLNLLLVGVDTRVSVPGWEPHGDAVLVLHVPAGLDRAYLFSLPRDLVVDIPAFPKSGYKGGRTKLTHAMSYGSRVPGKPKNPSAAQGYELLRSTVAGYTGLRFDAGAVITFNGFDRLVDTLGGVDLYVDQRVPSLHRRPDGKYRDPAPGWRRLHRPADGLREGRAAPERLAGAGLRPAALHHRRRLRPAAAPAAAPPGDGRKILGENLAREPDRVEQVVAALGDTLVYRGRAAHRRPGVRPGWPERRPDHPGRPARRRGGQGQQLPG